MLVQGKNIDTGSSYNIYKDSGTLAYDIEVPWKTLAHANQDVFSLQTNYSINDQSALMNNEQLLTLRKPASMKQLGH